MKWIKQKISNYLIRWVSRELRPPREFPLSNFERIQYEIRPCDVLLIEGRTRVAEVIKLITQSSWSHAALYIGRLHDITDHKLRAHILSFCQTHPGEKPLVIESMLGRGIIVTPLEFYRQEHIRICRPKGLVQQDAQAVITYVVKRLGIHYDVRQIFDLARLMFPWVILPRRWRSSLFNHDPGAPLRESCTSLIAEAFNSVNFPILPVFKLDESKAVEILKRNPRLFTPSDFDYSPFFEIIKYPIVDLGVHVVYRNLPWSKESIVSDDEGKVLLPDVSGKHEEALSAAVKATNDEKEKTATEKGFDSKNSTEFLD